MTYDDQTRQTLYQATIKSYLLRGKLQDGTIVEGAIIREDNPQEGITRILRGDRIYIIEIGVLKPRVTSRKAIQRLEREAQAISA